MGKNITTWLVVLLLAVMLVVACSGPSRGQATATVNPIIVTGPPAPARSTEVAILTNNGDGSRRALEFTIPNNCPDQHFYWIAHQQDRRNPAPELEFRLYNTAGQLVVEPVLTFWPREYWEVDGNRLWSLDRDTYYLDIFSGNAVWEYQVRCSNSF